MVSGYLLSYKGDPEDCRVSPASHVHVDASQLSGPATSYPNYEQVLPVGLVASLGLLHTCKVSWVFVCVT